jgi:hypothetical protein
VESRMDPDLPSMTTQNRHCGHSLQDRGYAWKQAGKKEARAPDVPPRATPVAIVTAPDAPAVVVPEENTRDPDTPDDIALALTILTAPDDDCNEPPDAISTEPPKEVPPCPPRTSMLPPCFPPEPARRFTEPPRDVAETPAPAARYKAPPVSELEEPTTIETDPDAPPIALEVPMAM